MSILIKSPGNLNQETFEGAATFVADRSELLVVDLRSCIFADIYAMVTLLTITTLRAERLGHPVRLRLPNSRSTTTYLARMRFFQLLPEGVQYDREPPTVTEFPAHLLELSRLNIQDGERAIDKLCEFVAPQLPVRFREGFVVAVAEIGSNVIFHSQADIGFTAGQRYERNYRGRLAPRLHLVVGDAGIGIKESLKIGDAEVGQLTDKEAIAIALQPGTTSKPGVHSGVGLSTVREYADTFGGVLRIRSGYGSVMERQGLIVKRDVPGLPGTIVSVELCSPGRRR